MGGDRTCVQAEMELDEGGNGAELQMEPIAEGNSLQQIVSSQSDWRGIELLTCISESVHDPLNHGQWYEFSM